MEIAVCDDNKLFLRELEEQLHAIAEVKNISVFSDLAAFLLSIDAGKRYDAVLMDIEWDKNAAGLDAAKELYKLCPEAKIIYVTGHAERFSQHIFLHRANLSGYLAKPVDAGLLRANLQKVADNTEASEQPSLVLRQRGKYISVPFHEVYSIESYKHTIKVNTEEDPIVVYERLGKIVGALPAEFYQCHKSYIVNMRQIQRFGTDKIVLKNGMDVPVSRSKYNESKEAYFHFMGRTF
ncbi:MAG: LytTR family DNA-binding domain-containing protein [Oscillospiraceae bacterium]|nr:LytTR family DNA-binding domain-containing protein [Oscillospiraceae bacterium]